MGAECRVDAVHDSGRKHLCDFTWQTIYLRGYNAKQSHPSFHAVQFSKTVYGVPRTVVTLAAAGGILVVVFCEERSSSLQ